MRSRELDFNQIVPWTYFPSCFMVLTPSPFSGLCFGCFWSALRPKTLDLQSFWSISGGVSARVPQDLCALDVRAAATMKVTVMFGRTGVVVPCRDGWTVQDLIQQATQRVRKLLEQVCCIQTNWSHLRPSSVPCTHRNTFEWPSLYRPCFSSYTLPHHHDCYVW